MCTRHLVIGLLDVICRFMRINFDATRDSYFFYKYRYGKKSQVRSLPASNGGKIGVACRDAPVIMRKYAPAIIRPLLYFIRPKIIKKTIVKSVSKKARKRVCSRRGRYRRDTRDIAVLSLVHIQIRALFQPLWDPGRFRRKFCVRRQERFPMPKSTHPTRAE